MGEIELGQVTGKHQDLKGKKRLCKSTAAMETRQWKLGPVNDPCRSNSGCL